MGITHNYKGLGGLKQPPPFLSFYKKTVYKLNGTVYNIIKEGDCDGRYKSL
jgi:hypothetical protein